MVESGVEDCEMAEQVVVYNRSWYRMVTPLCDDLTKYRDLLYFHYLNRNYITLKGKWIVYNSLAGFNAACLMSTESKYNLHAGKAKFEKLARNYGEIFEEDLQQIFACKNVEQAKAFIEKVTTPFIQEKYKLLETPWKRLAEMLKKRDSKAVNYIKQFDSEGIAPKLLYDGHFLKRSEGLNQMNLNYNIMSNKNRKIFRSLWEKLYVGTEILLEPFKPKEDHYYHIVRTNKLQVKRLYLGQLNGTDKNETEQICNNDNHHHISEKNRKRAKISHEKSVEKFNGKLDANSVTTDVRELCTKKMVGGCNTKNDEISAEISHKKLDKNSADTTGHTTKKMVEVCNINKDEICAEISKAKLDVNSADTTKHLTEKKVENENVQAEISKEKLDSNLDADQHFTGELIAYYNTLLDKIGNYASKGLSNDALDNHNLLKKILRYTSLPRLRPKSLIGKATHE